MSSVALIEELNPDHEAVALREAAPTAIQLLLDLEQAGLLTPRSLAMAPEATYPQAESLGVFLGELKSRGNFYLGDWLLWVEKAYPEEFSQAAESTGLSEQTNLRVMTVCRNVPPSRRKDRLSWSVHAAVSGLDGREQNAWLSKADRNGWGYSELRANMRAARTEERPELPLDVGHDPNMALLLTAAQSLVRNAELAGENVIVRREDFAQVQAALGEED